MHTSLLFVVVVFITFNVINQSFLTLKFLITLVTSISLITVPLHGERPCKFPAVMTSELRTIMHKKLTNSPLIMMSRNVRICLPKFPADALNVGTDRFVNNVVRQVCLGAAAWMWGNLDKSTQYGHIYQAKGAVSVDRADLIDTADVKSK